MELRALAAADIEAAVEHYREHGGGRVALEFIDALEAALGQLRDAPHIGSLRFAYELRVPELRAWPLKRFPFVVFYLPRDDRIDVWRVLHSRRDLPAAFADQV